MITQVSLQNFGPLRQVHWKGLGKINLIIGGNGNGKTFLLKALYSAMRTLEEYKRGAVQRSAAEILVDKLYWTFQPEKIGDLVAKGGNGGHLRFSMTWGKDDFCYSFGKDTTKQISFLENYVPARQSNSIFLPAKEVLSLHDVILRSREEDKVFGFDDTYLDLARALRQSRRRGKNFPEFASARTELEALFGGKVECDEDNRWYFRKAGQKFPIGVTAEGIKKIAILDLLLSNRYLDLNSLVFIDEPESALHPRAISALLDIVANLADRGIQFFLASHSYFVIKKLLLISQQKNMSIPVLASEDGEWRQADLKDGMPDNAIIDESIRLYEEEVEIALA